MQDSEGQMFIPGLKYNMIVTLRLPFTCFLLFFPHEPALLFTY
jgi:hypothetical protein